MRDKNSRLVYSTEQGRIKPADSPKSAPKGDGIIRIRRESKGRKGKGVSLCEGFELDEKSLKALGKELKQACGSGGTVKAGVIEVQTDQRDKLKSILENKGYTVKLAGG
ncbi:stress response translation initiation inhibitor YciH [Agaribacterium haliotis]|uniref:stress response translation initiation inhibitor YciH n=1 Tax=Agaribacterium haliotis TaxID=2013869 RepID=UPI000BB53F0D|nr:stress response translation initiation inhibitor YciH [Agaribacterium haliotis]